MSRPLSSDVELRMLGWLKKWREPPQNQSLTPEQRRQQWEEQGRKERVFLDSLEKKLADNFPPPPEPPAAAESLAGEHFKMDRAPREPHFGEVERLSPLEPDGFERVPSAQM